MCFGKLPQSSQAMYQAKSQRTLTEHMWINLLYLDLNELRSYLFRNVSVLLYDTLHWIQLIYATDSHVSIMYESNPRVPIPPGQTPGIWHESSPGWAGIWHLFRSRYPGHLTPWKKRRNVLCIPIICININRDSSVKGCFQFYFVTTWAQWSIENKNKY